MAKSKSSETEKKAWNFPELGVTIFSETQEEALAQIKSNHNKPCPQK